MRVLLAILLLVLTGCSWGLREERGYNAAAIVQGAQAAQALVKELDEPEITVERIVTVRKQIKRELIDIYERAEISRQDHDGPPPVEIKRWNEDGTYTEADSQHLYALAGMVQAKQTRRRILSEIPARLAAGAARMVSGVAKALLPAWLRLLLKIGAGIAALSATGVAGLWFWAKLSLYRTAAREAIERFAKLGKEKCKELTADAPNLGIIYERDRAKKRVTEKKNGAPK